MNSKMLIALTEKYIEAFHKKNLTAIASLLHPECSLTDPNVRDCTPKEAVLDMVGGIFSAAGDDLSFVARNIFAADQVTFIEFELRIAGANYEGVDIVEWQDEKIISIRAYLHEI